MYDIYTGRADQPLLVSKKDTAKMLGVGETTVYHLGKERELEKVRIGARSLYTIESIHALIERRKKAETQ